MNFARKRLLGAAGLGAALVLAGPASALSIFTVGVNNNTNPGGDPGLTSGWHLVDDYNSVVLASNGVARTGTQTYTHGVTEIDTGPVALYYNSGTGIAAQPYNPHTTFGNFEALQPGGTATFDFGTNIKSFSAYLGSIDTYNYIDILGANGLIEQISGSQLVSSDYGNQTAGITNRRLFLDNLPAGTTGIEFITTGIAFEFDGIAVSYSGNPGAPRGPAIFLPVPEPATWAMMILGLFGVGLGLRTSRRSQQALIRP